MDDNPVNLQVLVGMLKDRGYKVRPVPGGKMALLAARRDPPDLILLDINMPEMNGYEVCEHLKADDRLKDIPVIFITGLTELPDKVKAFAVGGVDYITKPFQMEELHARVETHLTLRRMRGDLEEANSRLEQRMADRTADVHRRTVQLQALALEMTQVENRERRRMAQVLHDHIQQLLVAAKMRLESLDKVPYKGGSNFQKFYDILDESIEGCRSLAIELSPPILYTGGLVAALDWLARWMLEKYGLEVLVVVDAAADPGDIDIKAFLFQTTRELLFNTVKHAGVAQAQIRLRFGEDGLVELEIEDQGKGFVMENASGTPRLGTVSRSGEGFGLLSIRERLELLGGRMEVDAAPGRGTRISVFLPT
ncbi:MAG: response regulator [Planctomycetota bacterium]|nr:response regulator [Planctomycetota bacterium]